MDPSASRRRSTARTPTSWTASPYAPFGRAVPVDGGFLFSGRWPYSTGTDHADWVILGGMVADEPGRLPVVPPDVRHFVLPRADYTIVPDSWNVMGLRGTGSKDVVVDERLRARPPRRRRRPGCTTAATPASAGPTRPLFAMMFGLMFPAAIAAGTFGIARARHPGVRARPWRAGCRWPALSAAPAPVQVERLAAPRPTSRRASTTSGPSIAELYDHVERRRRDQRRPAPAGSDATRCGPPDGASTAIDQLFRARRLRLDGRAATRSSGPGVTCTSPAPTSATPPS